jgi:hypothetical protein
MSGLAQVHIYCNSRRRDCIAQGRPAVLATTTGWLLEWLAIGQFCSSESLQQGRRGGGGDVRV